MAEDKGWAGAWEPNIVSEDVLNELKDRAGEPVMGRSSRPLEICTVNLRTGEFQYPSAGGAGAVKRFRT